MQVGITAWKQGDDFLSPRTSAVFHDRHMGQHGDLGDPISFLSDQEAAPNAATDCRGETHGRLEYGISSDNLELQQWPEGQRKLCA